MFKSLTLLLFALLVLTSCNQQEPAQQIRVILIADGRERTFQLPTATTVEEFLRDPRVDIDWGELDQINPPLFTQITDGMQITIARVAERSECVQEEIPFAQRVELNEGLQPGEQRVVQPGENGILEICYRVTLVDSIPRDRIEANRTEIEPARDEILYVGPTDEVEPVVITGTIAYISNGNAWIMQGSSTTKRPITTESDLDSKVCSDFQRMVGGSCLHAAQPMIPISLLISFGLSLMYPFQPRRGAWFWRISFTRIGSLVSKIHSRIHAESLVPPRPDFWP
jgi:resuscitation-promoting factor RpfB